MEEQMKMDIRLRHKCPSCTDTGRPLKRVWGFPTARTFELEQEGRIAIAGCLLTLEQAKYECRHCGADWHIQRD